MGTLFGGGLPRDRLLNHLVKAVDYLNSTQFVVKGKVGSVGCCFGGGISINLACHVETAARIIFYGENPNPIDLIQNVKCPIMGLYRGEDDGINSKPR